LREWRRESPGNCVVRGVHSIFALTISVSRQRDFARLAYRCRVLFKRIGEMRL